MLFRKKLPRSCGYCSFSTELSDGTVLCAKKGMMAADNSCRKFRYEPTRRFPKKQKTPDFSQYDQEDFSL